MGSRLKATSAAQAQAAQAQAFRQQQQYWGGSGAHLMIKEEAE
jgi:hypothetical protein